MQKLLNTHEAAEVVGLAKRTLDQLRQDGGGPPYRRLGRSVRYELADLEAWIQAQPRYESTSQYPLEEDAA